MNITSSPCPQGFPRQSTPASGGSASSDHVLPFSPPSFSPSSPLSTCAFLYCLCLSWKVSYHEGGNLLWFCSLLNPQDVEQSLAARRQSILISSVTKWLALCGFLPEVFFSCKFSVMHMHYLPSLAENVREGKRILPLLSTDHRMKPQTPWQMLAF